MGSQEAFGVDHTLSSTQQNGPSKPWIIQKFGGTSIGKFAERIVDELARYDSFVIGRKPQMLVVERR